MGPGSPMSLPLKAFPGLTGELPELTRSFDWKTTPAGAVSDWPLSLRTTVQIMLSSRYAMWMGWGPELTFFYNDAYQPTLGVKHPWALGQSAREVWREIWPSIGPRIEKVLATGEATWDESLLLFLERHGYPEETYHTFSYSPLTDDEGHINGMLCVVTEETDRVIGERRLRVLRELATGLGKARHEAQVRQSVSVCLDQHVHDLPFTLTYRLNGSGTEAGLVAQSGTGANTLVGPEALPLDDSRKSPFVAALRDRAPAIVDLAGLGVQFPTGPWELPPTQAIVLPLGQQLADHPLTVFIGGLNPHRPFDAAYRGFVELVVGQIAAGLAAADAYEAEHRRAEALAEIDRAKTAFFSNASHEFRTPLTLMLSPLEDMLDRTPAHVSVTAERDEIELVHRNGLRLLKLVNTLLDFSRIEAGRFQAVYEPVDLAQYTAELASTFRSAMQRAGLNFSIEATPVPEQVYVDRDMWEKIVLNLLSNAFKFTLQGGVTVIFGPAPDGEHAALTVRDTGVGIPKNELPRLFERFHRIEGQAGRSQEGTGIGLALVHELVKLHGGSVHVTSQPGEGTEITVLIPTGLDHLPSDSITRERTLLPTSVRAEAFLVEALRWLPGSAAADPDIATELLEAKAPEALPGSKPRLLLADDNADMRDYVTRLLQQRYAVEAVPDGEAALAAARAQRPDLVLSDVMMPRLDGFGLLTALRGDPALADIPIILLSARAGEEAKVEGLEAGADDYLTKPFTARELLARIASNLDLARLRQRAADVLRAEAHRLNVLNRTANTLAAEIELEPLVQTVTDAATELTGAQFGAFFYNVADQGEESYLLYTLSGASREAFIDFAQPRITEVFAPTFSGKGVVRSGDIRQDPRYGRNAPLSGLPAGHLPVVSYLAVPVIAPSGDVLGGLFFGHEEADRFSPQHELIVTGIASQAAVAFEKARLYTASRQATTELRQLNETLEQRVAIEVGERMKAEEALRQAQKMEAIGQLTGGVAHDFNNLLQVVLGNLDALKRRIDGTVPLQANDIERSVAAAIRGAERAANLTQRLLAFARRQPLDPRPTDVNRLLSGMSDLLRRTLGENIAIETVLGGGTWRVFADPNQLESAILNLAVNARDAMPAGGKLTIESANAYLDEAYAREHQEVQPGQYVVLAVSDTGVGMSKDIIALAFDPFFTTKEVGHGTGLGLSQVYGFVKQSQGHVKIYSEPGEGTTVRIYLPRPTEPAPADEEAHDLSFPTGRSTELILLVEDDDAVRELSAMMLRDLGYEVIEAEDGAKALRMIEALPDIRLLFTDVGLPGGFNGRQLADAARGRRPDLNVLFTTGYARNAIVHQGRLDPGIDLLPKPFTMASLAQKIREILDRG
ncbi:MAG: response regulator [Alphaproteobacteria bacterium]|nr:response regulator [Alphaproteobacteria bacterium]